MSNTATIIELKYPSISPANAQAIAESETFFEKSEKPRFKNSAEMFESLGL
jgi:hypothetical protein